MNRPCGKGVICHLCDKNLSSTSVLNRHFKNVHFGYKEDESNSKSRIICPFESCGEKFFRFVNLRNHVQKVHKVNLKQEDFEFGSIEGKHV